MNIENAKKLVGQLERLPDEKFDMGVWVAHPEEFTQYRIRRPKSCGTIACIAGWAALSNRAELDDNIYYFGWAMDWLDLTQIEAEYLFLGHFVFFKNGNLKPKAHIKLADAIAELNRMIAEAEKAAA